MKKVYLFMFMMLLFLPIGVKAETLFYGYDFDFDINKYDYSLNVDSSVDTFSICSEEYANENSNNICMKDKDIYSYNSYILLNNELIYAYSGYHVDSESEWIDELSKKYELSELLLMSNYIQSIINNKNENQEYVEYDKETYEGFEKDGYINNKLVYKNAYKKIGDSIMQNDIYVYDENENLLMHLYSKSKANESREGDVTIYNYNGEIIYHEIFQSGGHDPVIDFMNLGKIKEGNNVLKLIKMDDDGNEKTYIIDINREYNYTSEYNKDELNVINENDNINESPKTGSFKNLIVSIILILSLITLLLFNRKLNREE